jgi:hypothetical protein
MMAKRPVHGPKRPVHGTKRLVHGPKRPVPSHQVQRRKRKPVDSGESRKIYVIQQFSI